MLNLFKKIINSVSDFKISIKLHLHLDISEIILHKNKKIY